MNAETPIAIERPVQPYPGLRPFEANEWSIFFGRERMIDEVIERLALNGLVLIHGASGSGKSSLVRAGRHAEVGASASTARLAVADGHDAAIRRSVMEPCRGISASGWTR